MEEQIQAWQTIILLLTEYSVFVLGTGAFVFRKKIAGRGFIYGLLISLVMGNVLCINLVFVAFLLHCYKLWGIFCLWFLLIIWSWLWPIRKALPAKLEHGILIIQKVLNREYGVRLIRNRIFHKIASFLKRVLGTFLKVYFFPHLLEILFVTGIMIFNIWYNSYQAIHMGGIGVPDVSVHTEWIQKMREGNIFGNGIYPFGFHCIIYLIITLFQNQLIPVMVYFAFVQDFWIFLLFYILMRKSFRFSGTAVLGFFVFSVLSSTSNYRYQFTIPQEYGMIGLYPAILFLWIYLEEKIKEIKVQKIRPEKEDSNEARRLIRRLNRKIRLRDKGANELVWYFGFSVALTFMCHFYITIACFFLCAGLVLLYMNVVFRYKCFVPLVISVFTCMAIALAPMVGWYAAGKPLEGSLNWAMGVMKGDQVEGENQQEDDSEKVASEPEELKENADKVTGEIEETSDSTDKNNKEDVKVTEEEKFWQELKTKSLPWKIYGIVRKICLEIIGKQGGIYFFFSILTAISYGFLLLLYKKRREQGRLILGISAYLLMLLILARASWFGLPTLMNAERTVIFIDYIAGFFFAVPLEAITGWFSSIKWVRLLVSLSIYAFNGLILLQSVEKDQIKHLSVYNMLQYRPALDLAEEIMNEYEDHTWTIVSTVDELPFIRLNGYHYEWLEFLSKQAKFQKKKQFSIPTKYIFFYIEKKPLAYAAPVKVGLDIPDYEPVNEKDANTIFNEMEEMKSDLYSSHRNIIESKAYYWAKNYAFYFPREMTVYYEDENFICYRLVQDPYRLNNLIINYGYNVGQYRIEDEKDEKE